MGLGQVEPARGPRQAAAAAMASLAVFASGMNSAALAESVDFGMAAKGSAEYYGFGVQRGYVPFSTTGRWVGAWLLACSLQTPFAVISVTATYLSGLFVFL